MVEAQKKGGGVLGAARFEMYFNTYSNAAGGQGTGKPFSLTFFA